MKIAHRVSLIKPSATLAMSAKAKALAAEGIPVIDFGVGEPDFDTPEIVKESGIEAIRAGFTKYTAPGGIDSLKMAILKQFEKEKGLVYERSEILISCGAKHSLYNIAQALFEKGDEVIIPSPYWVSYPDQVLLNEATPVFLPTREEEGFLIDPERLQKAITSRTKALIINTPSNPTGAALTRQNLSAIAEVVLRNRVLVIFDEIYEKIIYDGFEHVTFPALLPGLRDLTLIVNGVSKSYSMTGWRIGYTIGPKEIIKAMEVLQSQSTSNPCSISQKAAVTAIESGAPFTRTMVREFDIRRRYMVDRLNRIKGVRCTMPKGAFYAFPHVASLFGRRGPTGSVRNSIDLAGYLLETAHVAVVAGEPFGAYSYVRLSYATSMENITGGLDRIEKALNNLT